MMRIESFFETLRDVQKVMSPQTPLATAMMNILRILAKNHGYVRAFLAIFDPEANSLKLTVAHGPNKISQAAYPEGKGVTGQVLATGKSIVVPVIKDQPDFLNIAFERTEAEQAELSFISVPIKTAWESENEEILGALSVDYHLAPEDELNEHRQFLEIIGMIIANQVARLQEEMARHKYMSSLGFTSANLPDSQMPSIGKIVVASKSMKLVLQQSAQVGPSRATVLLRGESGTGKELLAEAIHQSGPRKKKPLVKLNCAALPSELIESELFGHERGAFTGAVHAKKGLFELAHQGTLFLDEIGELSLSAQAKVLRAIQDKEILRIGGEQTISVDCRLICATHRNLEEQIAEGRFREDLYYRINVFPIFIPPLRERREDILPLAEYFLKEFSKEYGREIRRISTPAIDLLSQYHWPGNVRELRNCLERAVLLCNEEVIRSYHLPPTLQTAESSATETNLSFGEAVAKFEHELLVEALKKAKGNMLQAARDLRVSYRIVNYKIKKFGLDPRKFVVGKGRK